MKIVFDLDGTLIDVSDRHFGVYKEAVKLCAGRPLDKSRYWELKRAGTTWPQILRASSISQERVDEFLEQFIFHIEDPERLKSDKLFLGAREILQQLSQTHNLYLISLRRRAENFFNEVQKLGIETYFEKIRTGHTDNEGYKLKVKLIKDMLGNNKPDIVIGDTEADIKAAQKLGAKSIAVLSGIRDRVQLRALKPDIIIESIQALPQI